MKNYNSYHGNRKKNVNILKVIVFLLSVLAIGGAIFCKIYAQSHFLRDTVIQETNCSFMTVEEAYDAICDNLDSQNFTVIFANSKHEIFGKDIGLVLNDIGYLNTILEQQENDLHAPRTYTIKNGIEIDHQKVLKYLKTFPELQLENMQEPQNAHIIVQEDGTLAIEKEILGTEINFEKAVSYFEETILSGEITVDFNSITNVLPEITSTNPELNQMVSSINKVLSTTIQYQFDNGSTYTLDKKILKSWVCTDENGKFYIDFNNISNFVEELNKKAQAVTQEITFHPTGLEKEISIQLKLQIDIEKESQLIKEELLESGTYSRVPMYRINLLKSYIEVDITRQLVWLYYEGKCILETKCVTGKKGSHDTPTGVYYLNYKTTKTYLRGYNSDGSKYSSFVNFWMPFNGGIGFHDAMWRSSFGGTIYLTSGSHGCVNLPYASAQTIYKYITPMMPIIVYCS